MTPPKTSTTDRSFKIRALRAILGISAQLSPELAAALAVRLFTTPRRHPRPAREASFLQRARAIPEDPGSPAAWRWGEGPVVLLVHGWEGRGTQLGSFIDPLVSAGFSVVAFDAPAHGATPGRRATLLDFRDAIRSMARRHGPLHAILAHSFGAPAAELALDSGVTARSAVFIAPPARFDGVETFSRMLALAGKARKAMERRLEEQVGHRFDQIDPLTIATRMKASLLVVHDSADPEVPFSSGAALAAAWPGASLVATLGLGHRRLLREPEVVRAVVEFVSRSANLRADLVSLAAT